MTALFDFLKKKEVKKQVPKVEKKESVKVPKVEKKEPVKAPIKKKDLREVYKILKEPHVSEKATQLADTGKYVFKVFSRTNKVQIAKAVANLYGVEVDNVNIINIKPKTRVLRGKEGFKSGHKKAVVTLKPGHKIEIMPH